MFLITVITVIFTAQVKSALSELAHLKSSDSLLSFQSRIIEIFKLLGALHHQRYWLIIFQFNTSPFSFLLHIETQFSMFLQVFVL